MPLHTNIYCISGLGADHRLFSQLQIPGCRFVAVPWVPWHEEDHMTSYAKRMFQTIPEENPIVLGLSFGGMLTTEIAKAFTVRKAIIVSSAKTRNEAGYKNSFINWLNRSQLVPANLFNYPFRFELFSLGAETQKERSLLRNVIRDGNPAFVKSCVNALLTWENDTIPAGIVHIHGTKDRVLYPGNVHPDHWVQGGSHIMIYNRAAEVSGLIAAHL